jgi:thiol-disulfide isomerase/thioredoxin
MPVTKPRFIAIAIAAGAAVLLTVLYWIAPVSVHAPPQSLAPLRLTEPAKPVPDMVFTGAGGKLHSLRDFKGKLVLLNLWAPWCGPCVKELPALAALEKALPGERFTVVAVDVGREGQGEAAAFLKAHGAQALDAYVDSNASLYRAFGGYGLPVSVLIDAEGNEIARAEGPAEWSDPDSVAWIKAMAER